MSSVDFSSIAQTRVYLKCFDFELRHDKTHGKDFVKWVVGCSLSV